MQLIPLSHYILVSYSSEIYRQIVEELLWWRRTELLKSVGSSEVLTIDILNPFGHITSREQRCREEYLDKIGQGAIERVTIYGDRHSPYIGAVLKAYPFSVGNEALSGSKLQSAIRQHEIFRLTRALS